MSIIVLSGNYELGGHHAQRQPWQTLYFSEMTDFIFTDLESKQNFAESWDESPEFGYHIQLEIPPRTLRDGSSVSMTWLAWRHLVKGWGSMLIMMGSWAGCGLGLAPRDTCWGRESDIFKPKMHAHSQRNRSKWKEELERPILTSTCSPTGWNSLDELGIKLALIYQNPQGSFKVSPVKDHTTVQPRILFLLPPQRSPATQPMWHSVLSLLDHTFLLKPLLKFYWFQVNNPWKVFLPRGGLKASFFPQSQQDGISLHFRKGICLIATAHSQRPLHSFTGNHFSTWIIHFQFLTRPMTSRCFKMAGSGFCLLECWFSPNKVFWASHNVNQVWNFQRSWRTWNKKLEELS